MTPGLWRQQAIWSLVILQTEALRELNRIDEFLSLKLGKESILYAIAESSKDKMKNKNNPARPAGAGIVSSHNKKIDEAFSKDENLFIKDVCSTLLKYEFGYHY